MSHQPKAFLRLHPIHWLRGSVCKLVEAAKYLYCVKSGSSAISLSRTPSVKNLIFVTPCRKKLKIIAPYLHLHPAVEHKTFGFYY